MIKLWILSAISLSTLISCGGLPQVPEVWRCQFNGDPRRFYCVNTKTEAEMIIDAEDEKMRAAQCLSIEDYLKMHHWVENLKKEYLECKGY